MTVPIANAQDVDDGDREIEVAAPDPLNLLPIGDPGEDCSIDGLPVVVQVISRGRVGTIDLPVMTGAASWRVDGRVVYAGHEARWTQDGAPGVPLTLALPADAYADPYQEEWLSRIEITATAFSASGAALGETLAEHVWVVWDLGARAAPTWLDRPGRALVAPLGAWSAAARAQVAGVVVPNLETADMVPPRSRP